jgi:hypothetical protein
MKTFVLVIAWMLIAVPLGWGVYQSVQKSMPLFQWQSEPAASSRQASQSCCCFERSGNCSAAGISAVRVESKTGKAPFQAERALFINSVT